MTTGGITHAAKCQAPDGNFYPYNSPQCDPKVPKCSSSIDHLIREKNVDSAWIQELQRICRGAKIGEDGRVIVLNGKQFHTFRFNTQKSKSASTPVNYSNEIVTRCKHSTKKLDCESNEANIYCSSLATAAEKSLCFKQIQAHFENKAKETDKEIERAKREADLRIQMIKQNAGSGS
ncbi:MAG: hypothetical protein Q7U45_14815 [Burkholderiaceae bacterium]|nr:hypothetical protein [Burkholderiaceae bacterium]